MKKISGILSGRQVWIIRLRMRLFIIWEAIWFYRRPVKAFNELKRLQQINRDRTGNIIVKLVRSGKKYYFTTDYPGYPSANLKAILRGEFGGQDGSPDINANPAVLKTLVWGITNRCPLSCAHCYEWDNIERSDVLGLDSLKRILGIFQQNGIRHLQISGGEPLARFRDLIELLKEASPGMDCWLLTSGYGLTVEKAAALKQAGMIGAHISLDHWEEHLHNTFRNNDKSYGMALEAAQNCVNAGIMVSLSLCATREFVTEENLIKYAELAKSLGVQFIRILEPREAGKFSGLNVRLGEEQVNLISEFVIRLNSNPHFHDYPIAAFLGYHQRKTECYGAGNRFIYVDPNGDVHACPFCRGKMGNLLHEPYNAVIRRVKERGCRLFEESSQQTITG
jgi:MoaA/NifB/PqqE/SkfB family radical SAM enzyme